MAWLKSAIASLKHTQTKEPYQTESPLLHEAISDSNARRVERLLKQGADVHARSVHGLTPLQRAVLTGERRIAALLLAHDAAVDTRNAKGETPLHHAAENGDVEIAAMLLDAGADPNARDAMGQTPLALASSTQGNTARKLLLLPDRQKVAYLLQERGGTV